jgi:O-antigen ligase
MEADRRFLLLCTGEVLIVALGNLAAALILQIFILALYLDDRRGYPVFIAAMVLYAAVIAASGRILLPLLALAVAFVCGYLALSLYDYRLSLWARGEA